MTTRRPAQMATDVLQSVTIIANQTQTTRTALYVRQSLDRTGDEAAVTRQEAECRDLAAQRGWEIVKVYSDNDTSASKGTRPQWSALLRDLDQGMYDVLLCWHTDRLYRRLRDLADLLEIAESRPLRIESVMATALDLSTPSGRMLAGMLGQAARYEVEQKGVRQVAANAARRASGMPVMGGPRPFGWEPDRVTPRESEAAVIRQAVAALRDLPPDVKGYAELRRIFKASGLPTTRNSYDWSAKSCELVMLNPRHAGLVSRSTQERTATGVKVQRRDILWDVQAAWPEIISRDEYRELCERLDPRSLMGASAVVYEQKRGRPSTTRYLSTGLALCSPCGRIMTVGSTKVRDNPTTQVIRCSSSRTRHQDGKRHVSIPPNQIEGQIRDAIIATYLLAPDFTQHAEDSGAQELRAALGERSEAEARLARLIDAVEADALTATEVAPRVAAARRAIAAAQDRVTVLKSASAHARMLADLSEAVSVGDLFVSDVARRRAIGERFDALTVEDQRTLASALVRVVVHPGRGPQRVEIRHLVAPWLDSDYEEADAV